MSYHVSSFNAKTRLSNLLEQVQGGKEFIITKHNHPIAKLIPINEESEDTKISHIIDQIRNIRSNCQLKPHGGTGSLKIEGRR